MFLKTSLISRTKSNSLIHKRKYKGREYTICPPEWLNLKKEEEEAVSIQSWWEYKQRILIHHSWECKLQEKKNKTLSTKADHSQDFHPTEIHAYLLQRTCSGTLMAALFIIAPHWKQHGYRIDKEIVTRSRD